MNKYLKDYTAGVHSPRASGFEHLNTLMCRDKLFEIEGSLTVEEKKQLDQADQHLVEVAAEFLTELQRITSLRYEREQRQASPERWWWYLDVIARLPASIVRPAKQAVTA